MFLDSQTIFECYFQWQISSDCFLRSLHATTTTTITSTTILIIDLIIMIFTSLLLNIINIIIIIIIISSSSTTAGQLCWRSLRSAGGRPTTQIVHTAGGRRQHFVNFIFAFLPFFLFVLRFLHSTFCSSVFDFDVIKHISSVTDDGSRQNFVILNNSMF